MRGLAKALFAEKMGITQPYSSWPFIEKLLNQQLLQYVDFAFAKGFFPDEKPEDEDAALFLATLMAHSRAGHLCLDLSKGEWDQRVLLGAEKIPSELFVEASEDKILYGTPICKLENRYYLERNFFFESKVIRGIKRLLEISFPEREIPSLPTQLKERQKEAIKCALSHPLVIISGGPGTGKTYTAGFLVKAFLESSQACISHNLDKKKRIIIAAPTGKAAKTLEEKLHLESSRDVEIICGTLHSLLKIRRSDDFIEEKTFLSADLIIVDECSMIDIRLGSALFSSVERGGHLVLMGDENQLPPVESGNLFGDLCNLACFSHKHCSKARQTVIPDGSELFDGKVCKPCRENVPISDGVTDVGDCPEVCEKCRLAKNLHVFPYVHLDECLRLERKELAELANSIQNEDMELDFPNNEGVSFHSLDIKEREAFFSSSRFIEKILTFFPGGLEKVEEDCLPKMEQFCILSPIRKGPLGVEEINQIVFRTLINHFKDSPYLAIPILITRTDYRLGLYNGEVGLLIKSLREEDVENEYAYFGEKKVPACFLPPYEYAYCLSIHKSQGCEYDEVLIFLPESGEVFGKEILYTAVTRARRKIELVGSKDVIFSCMKNSFPRNSGILSRMQNAV